MATAYLLASTVLVPIYGKLADMMSRKRIELFAVVTFLIGSVLCGAAGQFGALPLLGDGMNQLIAFRALQGENRTYQPRDLDGRPITSAEATHLAASLAVDTATRERLRNRKRQRGPREPQPGQPKAPQGTTRPAPTSLADQALEHARST